MLALSLTDRPTQEERDKRIQFYSAVQSEFLSVIQQASIQENSDSQLLRALESLLDEKFNEIRIEVPPHSEAPLGITFSDHVIGLIFELETIGNGLKSEKFLYTFARDPISLQIKEAQRHSLTSKIEFLFSERGELIMRYKGENPITATFKKVRFIRRMK